MRPLSNDDWFRDLTNSANNSRLNAYSDGDFTMLFGGHKIGRGSPRSVSLNDYGTWKGAL